MFLVVLIVVVLVVENKMALAGDLTLDLVRDSLIRQEDTIIFCLIERAKHPLNAPAYDQSYASFPGFSGSLLQYIVQQSEAMQATVSFCPFSFFKIFCWLCLIHMSFSLSAGFCFITRSMTCNDSVYVNIIILVFHNRST